jgi:Ubiquitin family
MNIFIKFPNGAVALYYILKSNPRCISLMVAIEDIDGIPLWQQKLYFRGREIAEHGRLNEYGLVHGSVLQLVIDDEKFEGAEQFLSKILNHVVKLWQFDNYQPSRHRIFSPGINAECFCQNTGCSVYNSRVIDPIGFGKFSCLEFINTTAAAGRKYRCPICHKRAFFLRICADQCAIEFLVPRPADQPVRATRYYNPNAPHLLFSAAALRSFPYVVWFNARPLPES